MLGPTPGVARMRPVSAHRQMRASRTTNSQEATPGVPRTLTARSAVASESVMSNETSGPQDPPTPGPQSFVVADAVPAGGNFIFAILAGAIAAVIGAAIWAVITVSTEYQIGFMAVGVGFLVGVAVRKFGGGSTEFYGMIGAVLALAGCILGNFFTLVGFFSIGQHLSFLSALGSIDYSLVPGAMLKAGSPMDLLFYGIAIYEGYKFSVRR